MAEPEIAVEHTRTEQKIPVDVVKVLNDLGCASVGTDKSPLLLAKKTMFDLGTEVFDDSQIGRGIRGDESDVMLSAVGKLNTQQGIERFLRRYLPAKAIMEEQLGDVIQPGGHNSEATTESSLVLDLDIVLGHVSKNLDWATGEYSSETIGSWRTALEKARSEGLSFFNEKEEEKLMPEVDKKPQ